MRLWHYKLIPYLPNKMLISQWRELIAIKRQWEKGTLKHRLVSYVMYYPKTFFMSYVMNVILELEKRGINYKELYLNEIINFCGSKSSLICLSLLGYPEHNPRYLKQCYYNLQEKYDRGIITEEEWIKIYDFVEDTL